MRREIMIPQRLISRLIGREGKNIKSLKQQFDCNIRVFDAEGNDKEKDGKLVLEAVS